MTNPTHRRRGARILIASAIAAASCLAAAGAYTEVHRAPDQP